MARQRHDKAWAEFLEWCQARHLKPLPAHAWTVAAYLRWRDRKDDGRDPGRADAAEPDRIVKAVSRAHLLCGYPSPHDHPVIAKTLASIARRRMTAADRADLFSMPRHQPSVDSTADSRVDSGEHGEDAPAEPEIVSGLRTDFSLRTRPRLVSKRVQNV